MLFDRILRTATTLANPAPWFRDALVVTSTHAGVSVTETVALGIPAVLSAVKLIGEGGASLPLKVFRRRPDGGREADEGHPLFVVLHDLFNPFQTSFEARTYALSCLLLHGNAYFEIERTAAGIITGLYPIRPDRMTSTFDEQGRRVYLYTTDAGAEVKWTSDPLLPAPILHLRGLGDGYQGFSVIKLAANALALAESESKHASKFFRNGASPSGVLKTPNALTDEVAQRIKASWEAAHAGSDNAFRVAVLEEGLEFQPMSISPEDAQLIESRRFSVQEVARIFRVPPHLLMDSSGSTSWGSGLESQTQAFLSFTLQPWLVNIEQAMQRDLLSRKGFYTHEIRHVVDGFARADLGARYTAYAQALDKGWMSVNEIRRMENLNPVSGGDEVVKKPAPTPTPEPLPEQDQDDEDPTIDG